MGKFLLLSIVLFSSALSAQPNILLIETDDQNIDTLPHMTYLLSKPGGSWIDFKNAFHAVPLCCPARAALITGRYPWTVGVVDNNGAKLDLTNNLGVQLQKLGYFTAWFGKFLNEYPYGDNPLEIPPGWSDFRDSGLGWYYGPVTLNVNGKPQSFDKTVYQTDLFRDWAVKFIETQEGPWFLSVQLFAPHSQFKPALRHQDAEVSFSLPPEFYETDLSDKPLYMRNMRVPKEAEMLNNKRQQARTLLSVDEAIKAMIDALIRCNKLEKTIIIFTTDNGWSDGSHRIVGKEVSFEEVIRAPLYIRYPGVTSRTETKMVSSMDLYPTILEAARGAPEGHHGKSLIPLIQNPTISWRDAVLIADRGGQNQLRYYGIRTVRYKYVIHDNGEEQLYDLVADKHELESQHNNPEYSTLKKELKQKLEELKP